MSEDSKKNEENQDQYSSASKEIIKIKEKIGIEELKRIVKTLEEQEKKIMIPVSCFGSDMGILEATVKYLKENKNLDFKEISKILNRRYTTISNTYAKAKNKKEEKFEKETSDIAIEATALSDRNVSPLYSVIKLLKEAYTMKFSQIAKTLARDQRNIASTYHKYHD